MLDPLRFIAPIPRLVADGAEWLTEVRRIELMGFHSVAVSHHITRGWQLGLIVAMAFAVASTSRLRVLSLAAQNDLHHPALLAKDIATIDALSGGRVELGIGTGWLPDDYAKLGMTIGKPSARVARLAEGLQIIRQYFTRERVDFEGNHYRVNGMEALPRCVQQPGPPILVGAGSPRMLDLAGRAADIVGIHASMRDHQINKAAVADLTAASIEAKIARVRAAAADAGRPTPRLQFNCCHVRVTDVPQSAVRPPTWAAHAEAKMGLLKDSPAVLVGTAEECAERLLGWRERFGITYWNLGPDVDAVSRIIERLGPAA
jgi:probable F420-dependent oxidoreductase